MWLETIKLHANKLWCKKLLVLVCYHLTQGITDAFKKWNVGNSKSGTGL